MYRKPTKNNRREFLKRSSIATAAIGLAPRILNADDKAGLKLPRMGAGEYTYECIHDWAMAQLPAGHHYGNASHGVTIDSQGLIYITHYGNPGSIFVFDEDARFVKSMGEQLLTARGTGAGHGIDIRKEGNDEFLYLSPNDSTQHFTKMSLKGEIVWQRGKEQLHADSGVYSSEKVAYRPTNASFRPDGGYYLGDGYGSGFLFHYDKNDKFVRALGGTGTDNGKFQTPHGQWLDDRDGTPKLVVADRANKRLQWFDMDDNHVRTQDGFLFPADIDLQGDLLLVPDLHARVTILNKANEPIVQLGDDPDWREQVLADNNAMRAKRPQWRAGRFVHPHDACFDRNGNIFVVEWVSTGRVTKLVKVS